jgi:hypothetical protein
MDWGGPSDKAGDKVTREQGDEKRTCRWRKTTAQRGPKSDGFSFDEIRRSTGAEKSEGDDLQVFRFANTVAFRMQDSFFASADCI